MDRNNVSLNLHLSTKEAPLSSLISGSIFFDTSSALSNYEIKISVKKIMVELFLQKAYKFASTLQTIFIKSKFFYFFRNVVFVESQTILTFLKNRNTIFEKNYLNYFEL